MHIATLKKFFVREMILMTQQEVIKTFMKSLDKTSKKGTAALDEAIRACSPFSNFQTAKNAIINDCRNAKSADDFLKTYCGINLSNKDTGAITGSDAGGSMTKTAESIVPEEGSLVMFNSGERFTVNGLTVKLGKRIGPLGKSTSITDRSFSDLSKQEIYLWRSIYTWWIKEGLNLIAESYGDNFSFTNNSATTKTMNIIFEDSGNNGTRATTYGGPSYYRKSTSNIDFFINLQYYGTAAGKNGEVYNDLHLDRNIAHELTHAVMRTNIDYFDYLPAFIREGTAELTHGIDDDRTNDIKKLANNPNLLSQSLLLNEEPVTLSGVSNPSYAGGYMFLRYLARQAGDLTIENKTANKNVLTFYGNDSIKSKGNKVTIDSGAGNDRISVIGGSNVFVNSGTGADYVAVGSEEKKVTISSGTGNDYINNWSTQASINTASGSDTVYNSSLASNVFISSGAGNDSIDNSGSKVTIDSDTSDDKINNYGNNVSIVGGMGNDSVWSYGSKTTINGGAGHDYLVNWGGAALIVGGSGNDIIWGDSDKDTLKGDAGNDRLHGEGGKDKIYGGAGNDSLWGGAGNDSLWGGDGKDTFIYTAGEGTDTIFDYEKGDMLKILKANGKNGSFTSSKYSGGTLAISGGGKVIFDDVSKSDKFNINGRSYKISGSKLK